MHKIQVLPKGILLNKSRKLFRKNVSYAQIFEFQVEEKIKILKCSQVLIFNFSRDTFKSEAFIFPWMENTPWGGILKNLFFSFLILYPVKNDLLKITLLFLP